MIKAYFFDWLETVGYLDKSNDPQLLLSREESDSLLINSLENSKVSCEKRSFVESRIWDVDLFLYSDSERVIESLKSKGYNLAIVSNMYDITTQRVKKLFPDFLKKFDVSVFSAEIGIKKPNTKIFGYALFELNKNSDGLIVSQNVMMIGNKQDKDIEPAIKSGM